MRFSGLAFAITVILNTLVIGFSPTLDVSRLLNESKRPAETLAFLNLGMRRVSADLGMIRLLIYYGSSEAMSDEIAKSGSQILYPGLKSRAERILILEPHFNYVRLYAAGALAFNLGRPQEALGLIKEGLLLEPHNLKYQAYAAAIAFASRGNPEEALETLDPYLKEADCPSMIKNVAAFIYLKIRNPQKAAELYTQLLSSRDAGYRKLAALMLARIRDGSIYRLRALKKR